MPNHTDHLDSSSRRQRVFILTLLVGLSLVTGCASNSSHYAHNDQKELQTAALQRWSSCLDSSLERQFVRDHNAKTAIESALEICQGHRSDVLATYPRKLEKPLDKKLKEQAYSRGLNKFAQTSHRSLVELAIKK